MSLMAPTRRHCADQAPPSGLLRSVRLFRLFLAEQSDPEKFYASLAEDAVQQVAEHAELGGRTVVDVGGGGGWFTAAFRARGAHCYLFEPDPAELSLPDRRAGRRGGRGRLLAAGPRRHGRRGVLLQRARACPRSDGADRGDDPRYPAGRAGVPVLHATGTPRGAGTRCPRGTIWARDTPSAGTSGAISASPSTRCGVNLFRVHVGPVLRALRARPDVEIVAARPRYYPRWCRLLLRLPGLREVATWNLMLIMRRVG